MSNLTDRSESPRRRVSHRRGRMHPGWECALSMWASGFMCALGTISVMFWGVGRVAEFWPAGICWIIWIAFFIHGGKLAERLRPMDER